MICSFWRSFFFEYLIASSSPIRSVTSITWSSISFVCAAEMQKRVRDSISGVAGKPAPIVATPIFSA